MKITKGIMIGVIFGFGLSFFISFVFMLVAQGLAGGFTSLGSKILWLLIRIGRKTYYQNIW